MPTTLTIKNVPDGLLERLKVAATAHRRSLNGEAIACLKTVLVPAKVTPTDLLARARELRAGLTPAKFQARDIDALKRQRRGVSRSACRQGGGLFDSQGSQNPRQGLFGG